MKRSDLLRTLAISSLLAAAGPLVGNGGRANAAPAPAGGSSMPLARDDPDAQLDPSVLHLPAISPRKAVAIPELSRPGVGSYEIVHSVRTGKTEISRLPAELRAGASSLESGRLRAEAGNLGPRFFRIETVFPYDDRERVADTASYPWCTICKLIMTFPNGQQYIGSGALIGAKYVLTAGDCIFSHDDGGWATSIEVIPGLDGTYKPFGSVWATNLRTYVGWTRDRNSDHDFGVITLNQEIGNSTGWLGYASYAEVVGTNAHLAGYPGDLDGGTGLYYTHGPIDGASDHQVWYHMDTAGGQSGSGVYRKNGEDRYVFAVHCWGASNVNGGTRLDSTKFNSIHDWRYSGN